MFPWQVTTRRLLAFAALFLHFAGFEFEMSKKKDSKDTPTSGEAKAAKPAKGGNGHAHVEVEQVAATELTHRPFSPSKIEQPLHRRVDRSFLDYAS